MLKVMEKFPLIPFLLAVFIAGAIFYFSSSSGDPVPGIKGFPYKAVIYHISIFFLLCFFLSIALVRGKHIDWLFFAVLFSIMYGFSDELHQYFVPGRASSLIDVFYDTVGVAFAFMTYYITLSWRNGKKALKPNGRNL